VELNTQAFEYFMETQVIPAYIDKHIFMILDNSKIHHAKSLLNFKKKYKDKISFIVCIMGLKPSASAETFRSMFLMKL